MADPYRAGSTPGSPALPGASANTGVARGLVELGDTISQFGTRERERNRQDEAASAGVELATIAGDLDTFTIDARTNAAPGGEGHTENVDKTADERIAAALDKIHDHQVRQAYANRYADLRSRIHTREYAWQTGERAGKFASDIDTQGTTYANIQAADPTPDGLQDALESVSTTITLSSVGILTDRQRAAAVKEQQRKIAVAWGNAMQDKDPHGLAATLEAGVLSSYLEPEDINTLRTGAHVEIRRADALARADLARQEAAARETISTTLNKVGDGYVPSAQEWETVKGLAKTYKLEGKEWDLGVAEDRVWVNRETRDWTPAQWSSSINELEAKGNKRSQAENVRLEHLKAARGPSVQRFNNDPYGAAAAGGNPAPAIDWSAPTGAAIEARKTWARSTRQATGLTYTPYLNPEELTQYRGRIQQGAPAQVDVASELRQVWGVAAAGEIARQLDASNKDLQFMVGLPPATAQFYKRGLGALARNEKLFDKNRASEIWQEYKGAIPPDLWDSVYNGARAIAAGVAEQNGHATLVEDSAFDGIFRAAINRAGGALGGGGSSSGGFGDWKGRRIWLPPTMTADDAARRLTRSKPAAWISAAGSEPYYQGADGKLVKLSADQLGFLRDYQLETVTPGVYRPIGRNGNPLSTKDGRPWQFDIRKLP